MQVQLLKLFLLIVLKCTIDHGQQHIVNDVQYNEQVDHKEQWSQWLTVIRFHHDIWKAA